VLVLACALGACPAAVHGATLLTNAADLGFIGPQASSDGLVIAMVRRHSKGGFPGDPLFNDVLVLDMRDCGQDVVREISVDGKSLDPSVTADGQTLAFRTDDPAVNPRHSFFVMSANGGTIPAPVATDNASSVSNLEISPTGTWLVFERTVGNTEELRLVTVSTGATVTIDSSTDLRLNVQHPITDGGTVYYSKVFNGIQSVYRASPPSYVPVAAVGGTLETTNASVTRDGTLVAYTGRNTTTNITDIWISGAIQAKLTFSDAPYTFQDVAISGTLGRITFASTGDHAGLNADKSIEVFSVGVAGGITQHSQFTNDPLETNLHAVVGVTADATGQGIVYSHGDCAFAPSCLGPTREHSFKVSFEGPTSALTPTAVTGSFVTPPFDVLPIDGVACVLLSSGPSCSVVLRNSGEGARNLLILREWIAGTGTCVSATRVPVQATLSSGQQVTFPEALTCPGSGSPGSVTYRVTVVGPDVAAADRAVVSIPFTF
jgi:hypothetical protein